MQRRHFTIAGLATTALLPHVAMAQTVVEHSGVKYPSTLAVAGQNLRLNGSGIRYRFVVKVYTAGLYLQGRAATPEAVLATPGPKRLHVVMLRDIDANELGKLFTRGMQDNVSRDDFAKSIPGTLRMADIFQAQKKLAVGDNFSVDWLPGRGTMVLVNGRPQGEPIAEPEFFNALMMIWLGPRPADVALKDALLGIARPTN
jgi:Chalcone isomerase-like